ncbi:Rrf2 family transcriptional regulator [Noviherbaspirillum sp.]|uniref:Rrf2 family transcriptional regulator n=1 Tax=Noviherbaspirillum sp. TaxID=1926288 RepID=UPI002D6C7C1E|nr:Rrf2 family transcriptional regulator [Noviherbaspirillum sp.]HZW20054.1 Rrf2 family transcriptional regulator [Noviherbaspirillum sp.]
MNARAMETPGIPEFLFGDRQLHARFSMAIELLARIVIANPKAVTTAALAESLGQSVRTVRALLGSLHQSGLLGQDDKVRDAWFCASPLGTITLADVFRSVASAEVRRRKPEPASEETRTASQQSVDLLLMQATMSINQVVLQHLQAFDLGRLKAVRASGGAHPFGYSARTYIAEPV